MRGKPTDSLADPGDQGDDGGGEAVGRGIGLAHGASPPLSPNRVALTKSEFAATLAIKARATRSISVSMSVVIVILAT